MVRLHLLLLGGWLLSIVGGAPANAAISVTDDLGTTVTLAQPARRIIGLAPDGVELLYAAGAGEYLVGTVPQADYPPEARRVPRVGSYSNPDEEAIIARKPDLVVLSFGNPQPLTERLRRRGLPVYVVNARRVADVPRTLRNLGRLLGSEAGEKAAAGFEERMEGVRRRVAGRPLVPAMLMVWHQPITVAGQGSYLNDALTLAGARNVVTLPQPYPSLDPEQALSMDPAVILYAGHDEQALAEAKKEAGIRGTTAGREGRIVPLDPNLLVRAGPRLAEGIELMAAALHPTEGAKAPALPRPARDEDRTREGLRPLDVVMSVGLVVLAAVILVLALRDRRTRL